MKIVILDESTFNHGDIDFSELQKFGDVIAYDWTKKDEIVNRVKDADIVFTCSVPITKQIINAMDIKYIGILATGYDLVDVDAAKTRGITVTNVPGYGTYSVAQMVFAQLLEICQNVAAHTESIKKGEWAEKVWSYYKYPLIELHGKTLGIIGYGRIGHEVSKIAHAFGMNVLVYDLNKKIKDDNVQFVNLDELYESSDVISLHCPLFDNNVQMINKNSIAKMKDGVIIINTSRGGLISDEDLSDALNSGKVYAAGIDVFSVEPVEKSNPLLSAKNIFLTPHVGWASKEARERLLKIAIQNLDSYLKGQCINVVNS